MWPKVTSFGARMICEKCGFPTYMPLNPAQLDPTHNVRHVVRRDHAHHARISRVKYAPQIIVHPSKQVECTVLEYTFDFDV
jgi:hypothetical protein